MFTEKTKKNKVDFANIMDSIECENLFKTLEDVYTLLDERIDIIYGLHNWLRDYDNEYNPVDWTSIENGEELLKTIDHALDVLDWLLKDSDWTNNSVNEIC